MEEPLESFDRKPEAPNALLGKVMLVNFIIMLIYITWSGKHDEYHLILKAFWVVIHTVIALITGIGFYLTKSYKPLGRAMVLSALLVPVVGFGVCLVKEDYF